MHKSHDPLIKVSEPSFNSSLDLFAIEAAYGKYPNAGYAHYRPQYHSMDRNNWKLIKIWVHNDFRQKGIGTKLFKTVFDNLKAQEATHVTWQVIPEQKGMTTTQLVDYYKSMLAITYPSLLNKTDVKEVGPNRYEMVHMTVKID